MNRFGFLPLACVLLAGSAVAGSSATSTRTAIAILTPVHFGSDEAAKRAVRENCELEKAVESELVDSLGADGRSVSTTKSTESGRVLEASIEGVEGLGGGGFTGHKSLSLKVRIYDGGKRVHSTMEGATSQGFVLAIGTCDLLAHAAAKASRSIAKWLDKVDEADAARSAISAAPASGPRE
jgi:hypothetical protein